MMRRFLLVRDEDPSGISGTGVVAEGVVFTDGTAVLRWRSTALPWGTILPTFAIHPDVPNIETLHGHQGSTRVEYLDEHGPGAQAIREFGTEGPLIPLPDRADRAGGLTDPG